jgi:hypothetical protein
MTAEWDEYRRICCMLCKMWADGGMDDDARSVLYPTVKPDGFCYLGERRNDV